MIRMLRQGERTVKDKLVEGEGLPAAILWKGIACGDPLNGGLQTK